MNSRLMGKCCPTAPDLGLPDASEVPDGSSLYDSGTYSMHDQSALLLRVSCLVCGYYSGAWVSGNRLTVGPNEHKDNMDFTIYLL